MPWMLGCRRMGSKPPRREPSAAARSPRASTSTASTRLPCRAAISASAAATVVLPVPPLPVTKTTRRPSSEATPGAARPRSAWPGDSLEHLGSVSRGAHGAPLAFDASVRPDEERAPLDSLVLAAGELLVDPQPQRLDEDPVGVADQRDPQ